MESTSSAHQVHRWLYCIALAVIGWVAFLCVISAQHVLSGAFHWAQAMRMTLNQWLPWIFLSPLVLWLAVRYPVERPHWFLRAALQLAACILSVGICVSLNEHVFPPPSRPTWKLEPSKAIIASQQQESRDPEKLQGRPEQTAIPPPPLLWMLIRFNVPMYFIFASLGHAVAYFRRSQQRERRALELEARLAQAKLQALRMQFHPHFLFNTLNAISTLVHTNPQAADEMIANLSELLRISLETATEQEIPLGRELEFLGRYLDIEQVRFGSRLRVEKNISYDVLNALVPTLILQPLVENAIRHGIQPKLAPGVIEISAKKIERSYFSPSETAAQA